MEQENIRIGKERFFQGIFTTNANRHNWKACLHAPKYPTNLKYDTTTYNSGWLRWSVEPLTTRFSLLFKLYFMRQTFTIVCIIILYHWSGPHHLKSSFCVWEGEQVWGHLRKHSICLRPWRPGYGGCVKIFWTLSLLGFRVLETALVDK